MFNGIREFVSRAARESPIVWLLDDLHWADETSLQLLRHLAPHLESLPVLVLGTYRDVDLEDGGPFERFLAAMVRHRQAGRMALRRLPEDAVSELLGELGGESPPDRVVRAIYDETEGNPFFVEEVFAHLSEEGRLFDERGRWKDNLQIDELDVPEGVRLVIGRRLERLAEATRKMLTLAAVVGRRFDLALLESLTEQGMDALLDAIEEAETAQLVLADSRHREASYGFTHELIRQTLLGGLSLPRRQRLHLKVADVMERQYVHKVDQHAGDLAHHLCQSGAAADPNRTARYLMLAGQRALQTAALDEAHDYFDRALSLEIEDERSRADLLFHRGHAHRGNGRTEEALVDWWTALDLYERLRENAQVGRTCAAIAYALLWFNRMDEAYEMASRGLVALEEVPSHDRCRLLALAGLMSEAVGRHARATEMLDRAESMARRLDDVELGGEVLSHKALACWGSLDARLGVEVGSRAVELLRPTSNLFWLADALSWTQIGLMCSGRLDEVEAMADETEDLIRRVYGLFRNAWHCRATIHLARGDLRGAGEWVERMLEEARGRGLPWVFWDLAFLGLIRWWSGDVERANEHLARGLELDTAPYAWSGVAAPGLFLVKAAKGDRSALTLLDTDILLPIEGKHNTTGRLFAVGCVVEGLALLGERERAARLYPQTLEAVERTTLNNFGLFPTIAAGIAATAGRDWDDALRHFRAAIRQAGDVPYKLEQPRARYWLSSMLVERDGPGDHDEAKQLLEEAIHGFREIGMPVYLDLAERLAARLGKGTPS